MGVLESMRDHNPQPSTLNLQPATLNPQPATLNPQPSTHNPQPSTHNPQPSPQVELLRQLLDRQCMLERERLSLMLIQVRSVTKSRKIRWFSHIGQCTRSGHFPGRRRPLLREGGPISYEPRPSRCSSPNSSRGQALQHALALLPLREAMKRGRLCARKHACVQRHL